MVIPIKYTFLIIICILWVLGGQIKNRIRDVGVPILLGIGIWLATKSLIVGFLSAGLFNVIRLGYGNYEEGEQNSFLGNITKDRNGWWIRCLYGLIVAVVGGIALKYYGYMDKVGFIAYILSNGLIGFLVSRLRLPVVLADICISAGIARVLFLI